LRLRIAAAALWAVPRAVGLADEIKRISIPDVHGRLIESFSVPAAMHSVLHHGRSVEPRVAEDTLRTMIEGRSALLSQSEPDEVQLLQDIFAANVSVPVRRESAGSDTLIHAHRTVAQILEPLEGRGARPPLEPPQREALRTLEAKGIRVVSSQGSNRLFIAPDRVLQELLQGTRWAGTQIDQLLSRLPHAERGQQRCGGVRSRGITLPWPGCLTSSGG
jgi:hypothetical protein